MKVKAYIPKYRIRVVEHEDVAGDQFRYWEVYDTKNMVISSFTKYDEALLCLNYLIHYLDED